MSKQQSLFADVYGVNEPVTELTVYRERKESERRSAEDRVIAQALAILEKRLLSRREGDVVLQAPEDVRHFLKLKLAEREHEVFAVLFLDNRHRVIAFEEMFRGTIDGAAVYPREVVKRSLELNAAALILGHNHPSGDTDPSGADKALTDRLKNALGLVDIRLLDHFIVGEGGLHSFAEHGLL